MNTEEAVPLHELLTPSEAARRLQRSTTSLGNYERRGLLAPLRLAQGQRLFDPREIDALARRLEKDKAR